MCSYHKFITIRPLDFWSNGLMKLLKTLHIRASAKFYSLINPFLVRDFFLDNKVSFK